MTTTTTQQLRDTILSLAVDRGRGKSICPSEAARALAGPNEKQWRRLMKPIRDVAVTMARGGDIVILRKGKPVDPDNFKGVYRITLPGDQGDGNS